MENKLEVNGKKRDRMSAKRERTREREREREREGQRDDRESESVRERDREREGERDERKERERMYQTIYKIVSEENNSIQYYFSPAALTSSQKVWYCKNFSS